MVPTRGYGWLLRLYTPSSQFTVVYAPQLPRLYTQLITGYTFTHYTVYPSYYTQFTPVCLITHRIRTFTPQVTCRGLQLHTRFSWLRAIADLRTLLIWLQFGLRLPRVYARWFTHGRTTFARTFTRVMPHTHAHAVVCIRAVGLVAAPRCLAIHIRVDTRFTVPVTHAHPRTRYLD